MSAFDFSNPPERLRTLVVETTTLCSLQCAGCGRTIGQGLGKWTDQHMSAVRFQRIVDHAPPAENICVQGVGEPTLNPELLEIVAIAKRSGKFNSISFSTHALARGTAYYQQLLDAGLSSFRVSVDSFDPEIAGRLRGGTDVVKLQSRVRRFAEKRFPFAVTITVSKHNMMELPDTLKILNEMAEAHRFGVGMHNFIYLTDEHREGPDYSSWVLDQADTRSIRRMLPEWRSCFPNVNIDYVPYFDGLGDSQVGICDAPRTEPWIGVDGAWGVCCYSANTSALGLTNVETVPFDQAWRAEEPQRFLEQYSKESPRFCDSCPKNCGRVSPRRAVPAESRG